jgi:hypothetical protein
VQKRLDAISSSVLISETEDPSRAEYVPDHVAVASKCQFSGSLRNRLQDGCSAN